MNRTLLVAAVLALALGCEGSGSTSDGGFDAGEFAQYDTLSGTFTTVSGVHATFSGAVFGDFLGPDFVYGAGLTFGDGNADPAVTVSSPVGATGSVGLSANLGAWYGPPLAESVTCASPTVSLGVVVNVQPAGGALLSYDTGVAGSSCAFTVLAPTQIQAYYFAHGSLTATLVGGPSTPALPDGGPDLATLSATW